MKTNKDKQEYNDFIVMNTAADKQLRIQTSLLEEWFQSELKKRYEEKTLWLLRGQIFTSQPTVSSYDIQTNQYSDEHKEGTPVKYLVPRTQSKSDKSIWKKISDKE